MPLRAILFDVGDTLWYTARRPDRDALRRTGEESARAALAAIGLEHPNPSEVATAAWHAANHGHVRARRSLVEPDYNELVRQSMRQMGLEMTPEQAGEVLRAIYVSGVQSGKCAYDDARPTLDALREMGFALGIVTNRAIGGDHFRGDLRAIGLDIAWDVIAVSSEVGHPKPHPAPFHAALEALSVDAAEAMMVGNSLKEDVAGAQELGMTTVWLEMEPDIEGVTPDYTITAIGQLLDLPPIRERAR
jgi:putative hydrolase of the HAD superfamily